VSAERPGSVDVVRDEQPKCQYSPTDVSAVSPVVSSDVRDEQRLNQLFRRL